MGPFALALRFGERPALGTVRAGKSVLGVVSGAELRTRALVLGAVLVTRGEADVPTVRGALGLGAVLRAGVAVEADSAGVRVLTTVPVAKPLDLPEHPDHAPVQIHVLPPQTQRLRLPKSQRQRHRPARTVPAILDHGQEVLSLFPGQRLNLVVLTGRRVDFGDSLFFRSASV
ncbi:hypothetical protein GCM10022252_45520 [Streptosporangium oxazolinicum]|uniref:Uncharacterized protein n=1 Tax=Streptosporangium oxazolinicum TaxID=909287 RepID=A0ABP8B3S5_9ACTN